ncbi:MAG: hypothetical protein HONBIEJF_02064 [Fimbriimonadaceae bacterium]|nr:hypothetical protein [Fimbriimonadaceae bacterium]
MTFGLLCALVPTLGLSSLAPALEEKEFTLVVLVSGIQGAESKAMRISPGGYASGFFRVDPKKDKGKRRAYGGDLSGDKDQIDRIKEVPADYEYSDAYGINKDLYICGSGDKSKTGNNPVAVVWRPKDKEWERVDLGAVFGNKISTAYGINDKNFVVGGYLQRNAELKADVVRGFYHELGKNNFEEMLASRFQVGMGQKKEVPYTHVIAASVNNQGHVVGSEFMSFGRASDQDRFGQRNIGYVDSNAFIWSTGKGKLVQVTPLKDTAGKLRDGGGKDTYAQDVNEHKLAVGGETVDKRNAIVQAVVWNAKTTDNTGPAVALEKVGGRASTYAYGVNTVGDPQKAIVVGKAYDVAGGKFTKEIAVRWKRKKDDTFEKGEDLNELTDFGAYGKKFVLAEARSISPAGEIVGWGYEYEDDERTKLRGIFSYKLKKKKPKEHQPE